MLKRSMRALGPSLVVVSVMAVISCSRGADVGATAGSSASKVPKGTLVLGAPVTASHVVPLAELAHNPSRFASEVVSTSGKVTAVCQEMGCWMEIRDETGQAHVRMHGHSFFVPKTAAGHFARIEGHVQASARPGPEEDCQENASGTLATASAPVSKVEFDATGVELD